jgi:hypothetical protein
MPAGPWVLVIGMHRSGTSAVAGVLGSLGFGLAREDDRMEWPESNPEHWESLSLGLHNEGLLNALGGSWDAPPDLPRHWEHSARILSGGDSGSLLARAYPRPGPAVWKDPRACILLPYWRTVLPGPIAAVFVWRAPMAVAHSLLQRDGMPLAAGLALWERYNRCAVEALNGVDTYVIDYRSVMADPSRFVQACADWLGSLDQFAVSRSGWDLDRAAASIATDLQHQPGEFSATDESLVAPEQRQLESTLRGLDGGHHPLTQALPSAETAWATAVIGSRRLAALRATMVEAAQQRFWATRAQLAQAHENLAQAHENLERATHSFDDQRRQLESELAYVKTRISSLEESTSWKITKPLRASVSTVERWRHQAPDS